QILSAVSRNKNDVPCAIEETKFRIQLEPQRGLAVNASHHGLQRIDDRIAGDDDLACRDSLPNKLRARSGRRRKMDIGMKRNDPAVRFFRKRLVETAGPEACLDVTDPYFLVKRRERCSGS